MTLDSNLAAHPGFGFDDPEVVARYADGPPRFVPGYRSMQQMAGQLLAERIDANSEILVVGAGGGQELKVFADMHPDWRFVAVDTSEEMLKQAERVIGPDAGRASWVHGFVEQAPAGPFDGGTCLLTLHFVPDSGEKLRTLQEIRRRLKPGSPFVIVDHCLDHHAADFSQKLDRYARFAINSGAPHDLVDLARAKVAAELNMVSPQREEELLQEAGFKDVDLFYAGFGWRGWYAEA